MKKVFVTILMFLPLMMSAQNVLTPQQQLEQAQKQLEEAKKAVEAAKVAAQKATEEKAASEGSKTSDGNSPASGQQGWVVPATEKKVENKKTEKLANGVALKKDPKYLEGAITTDADGKVQFVLNTDANGKSAQQIYDIVYGYMTKLTQGEQNIASRVALVNKGENIIANTMDEWLVFSASFLSLDRSEFRYQLVAKIADNSLQLTMNRMVYAYEQDRSTGFKEPAENVITDKVALTKKKNDLAKIFGKFRRCTIDRKDQIFNEITRLVKE